MWQWNILTPDNKEIQYLYKDKYKFDSELNLSKFLMNTFCCCTPSFLTSYIDIEVTNSKEGWIIDL